MANALWATRELTLRLFQQLHQNDDPEWYRSSGANLCKHCGLPYRDHRDDAENPGYDDSYDKRLCDGTIVHL
jgi:hypothetical protein